MEKTATVVEHVLFVGDADNPERVPAFSHADRLVVELHRAAMIRDAFLAGKAEPVFSTQRRTCTYPLDAKGRRLAQGSTVDNEELSANG